MIPCVAIGLILYHLPHLSLTVAAFYSCIAALLSLLVAIASPDRARSWLFWFTCIYFVFFQFGTIVAAISFRFDETVLNYATNFSNSLSVESINKSYIASGLCITFIWSFGVHLRFQASRRTVSYTHLRAHETVLDLVCRLLLEKKKKIIKKTELLIKQKINKLLR
eukprot:TRINITY_DN14650_c0_g1_i1.p1 TRINITY_DN14650_c0_g1~~TRINITY_DN14650_c0_g1_i1.p1  ORF type:complete len:166 (+),score=3.18 TRINITY_DN14650_c0_g1_i1:82-579(+)